MRPLIPVMSTERPAIAYRIAECARFDTTSIRWLCQGSGTRLLVRYANETPESGSAQQ